MRYDKCVESDNQQAKREVNRKRGGGKPPVRGLLVGIHCGSYACLSAKMRSTGMPRSRYNTSIADGMRQFKRFFRNVDGRELPDLDARPNGLRISCRRGALHQITSKTLRSCAPKAVSCMRGLGRRPVGRDPAYLVDASFLHACTTRTWIPLYLSSPVIL